MRDVNIDHCADCDSQPNGFDCICDHLKEVQEAEQEFTQENHE